MSVEVVTFGCRLNAAESEVIRREAERAGLSDTVVVNTCAVTAEAVRQARQTIRALRRERPQAKIVVTGCAAQTEPQTFAAMAEADRVLGNSEKLSGAAWARTRADFGVADAPKAIVNDIMAVKETAAASDRGFCRPHPRLRPGAERLRSSLHLLHHSRTAAAIRARCRWARWSPMCSALVANGYGEVVLTGVDITSYGADLPGAPKLGALVKQILKHVPELKRLRLSSIDSVEADRDLIDAFAQRRAADAASASVAAGRRRSHPQAHEAPAFAQGRHRVLRRDCAGCARTSCSAPTSSPASRPRREAMFTNSLDLVEECGLTHLHVFPFSPRPGTPAARMPQLDRAIVKERARASARARRARACGSISMPKSARRGAC